MRWLTLVLVLGACSNKLSGEVTVDGSPFKLDSCRSGQVYNFAGVELVAEDGRKLRLVMQPDGSADAYVFASGSATGDKVGSCGPVTVGQQNSTINNVRNVEGEARLDCARIKGNVKFENCH
jgi:hypothetical protein